MAASRTLDRPADHDRRRWSRYDLGDDVPAMLVAEGARFACVVENLSLGGATLRLAAPHRATGQIRVAGFGCDGPLGRCIWS